MRKTGTVLFFAALLALLVSLISSCGKRKETASRPSDDNPVLPGYLWDEAHATNNADAEVQVDSVTIIIPAGTFEDARVTLYQIPLPEPFEGLKVLNFPFGLQIRDLKTGSSPDANKDMQITVVLKGDLAEVKVHQLNPDGSVADFDPQIAEWGLLALKQSVASWPSRAVTAYFAITEAPSLDGKRNFQSQRGSEEGNTSEKGSSPPSAAGQTTATTTTTAPPTPDGGADDFPTPTPKPTPTPTQTPTPTATPTPENGTDAGTGGGTSDSSSGSDSGGDSGGEAAPGEYQIFLRHGTEGPQMFTVPPHVFELKIYGWGGGGGAMGPIGNDEIDNDSLGGAGGHAVKTLAVNPSDQLLIFIGSGGAPRGAPLLTKGSGGSAGYFAAPADVFAGAAGSGGGASIVEHEGTIILAAAGGGGGAYRASGGAGGGEVGQVGYSSTCEGGGGGSSNAPGHGGFGGDDCQNATALPGESQYGGAGGVGVLAGNGTPCYSGGGGGGGYFGGGGGEGQFNPFQTFCGGGVSGGGGGSSFGDQLFSGSGPNPPQGDAGILDEYSGLIPEYAGAGGGPLTSQVGGDGFVLIRYRFSGAEMGNGSAAGDGTGVSGTDGGQGPSILP